MALDLQGAAEKLAQATKDYEEAAREEATARSTATNALNRLNDAQRAFDSIVADMQKAAPLDSAWKRNTRNNTFVTVA